MAVHFYKENVEGSTTRWQAILDKPQLVKNIESAENKLIVHYEDGTYEEIQVSTSGGAGDIDLSTYMDKLTYTSEMNEGNVKKADTALEIVGIKKAQPFTFYGKDINGHIGFHLFPINTGEDANRAIEQRVLLNVQKGVIYSIASKYEVSTDKAIIQVYKFTKGDSDTISTIKEFNNGDEENFFYNKNRILLEKGCSIRNKQSIHIEQSNEVYRSEMIDKTKYLGSIVFEI